MCARFRHARQLFQFNQAVVVQLADTPEQAVKQDEDLAADELAIDEDEEPSADEEVDLATGDEDLGVATGDEDEEV